MEKQPKKKNGKSSSELWTDAELRSAVDAYLYALRLQKKGINCPPHLISDYLLAGMLRGRNEASIRYRMRNISHILQDRGYSIIRIYSPAPQVGSRVRARIERILDSYSTQALFDLTGEQGGELVPERQIIASDKLKINALEKLKVLKKTLEELEVEIITFGSKSKTAGIGHNRPPEEIDFPTFPDADIQQATDVVVQLAQEIDSDAPDPNSIESKRHALLSFGLKFTFWLGDRLTNFTDAAIKTLAPILVAKITGVLPHLIDAIESVGRFIETILK